MDIFLLSIRRAIFADDLDRQTWLDTLAQACAKTGWRIHAWVLCANIITSWSRPAAEKPPLPPEVLALFGQVYGVEQEARQAGMDAGQRLALRQQKSLPLMAALKTSARQMEPAGSFLQDGWLTIGAKVPVS